MAATEIFEDADHGVARGAFVTVAIVIFSALATISALLWLFFGPFAGALPAVLVTLLALALRTPFVAAKL